MPCPDTNLLLEFVAGLLSPEQRASIEEHMDRCAACRKTIAAAVMKTGDRRGARAAELAPTEPVEMLEAPPRLEPGQLVDHFKVIRLLGRGGMSEVYLARDTKLGRKVVLKVLVSPRRDGEQQLQRVLSEARATAKFSHPHIVTIHAVGECQGQPYLALEYLEGQTLQQRLTEKRLAAGELLRIGLAMAQALSEAHSHGVLHGDLKPANVMLTKTGRICVLDFGLAQAISTARPSPHQPPDPSETVFDPAPNHEHTLRGTPAYMAPEQLRTQQATSAADLWALGTILYEMAAGRRPYRHVLAASSDPAYPPLDSAAPAELAALVARCLEQAPTQRPVAKEVVDRLQRLLLPAAQLEAEESPFRGLQPFDERHCHLFCGRDEEIGAFVERLRDETVLAIVGGPGTGKSSFVRAGVIPRLRERGPLLVLRLRPGRQPFRTLAARILAVPGQPQANPADEELARLADVLRASPFRLNLLLHQLAERQQTQVLVFVDQLEELQALVPDRDVRQRFMEALCGAADDEESPVRIIVTMREEFLSRLAQGAGVREHLSNITVLRSPTTQELREVLTRPVQASGYSYDDPVLVDQMIAEVQGEAACLPLLQFAGEILWRSRDKEQRTLTRAAYQAMGGVAGALARHADGVLAAMDTVQVHTARVLLLRLVTADGTRQILHRSQTLEGLDQQQALAVLERLTEARLITTRQSAGESEPELELVHESLIAAWTRLARWIDESREELRFLAEISRAAELWAARGYRQEEVWRGKALRETERAIERCTTEPPPPVLRFLAAGQRKEKTRALRRQLLVGATFVLLALLVLVFATKEHEIRREKIRAEAQRSEALREGARAALLREDILEARAKLRTSLESLQVDDAALARLLWWRLSRDRQIWKTTLTDTPRGIDYAPDGSLIAAGCLDGSIHLLEPLAGRQQAILRGHRDQVLRVSFSPGGKYLASGSGDGEVWLWDLGSRTGQRMEGRHAIAVHGLGFSADGRLLASGGGDRSIRLWEVASRRQIALLSGHRGWVIGANFSPDGRWLVSSDMEGELWLWNVKTRTGRRLPVSHGGEIWEPTFSPDGKLILTAGLDGAARIWTGEGSRLKREFWGHNNRIYEARFHPDGELVATAGSDRTVRLWDVRTGHQLLVLHGHAGPVHGVRFGPGGKSFVTGGGDRTVRLWETRALGQEGEFAGHRAPVNGLSFSPDGRWLASGDEEGNLRIWAVQTGEPQRVLEGQGQPIATVSFSADGKLLASGAKDGTVRFWDPKTGRQARFTVGHESTIRALTFSLDGRLFATGSYDKTTRIWDARTNRLLRTLSGHSGGVSGVSFNPEGNQLATCGFDASVRLWEVESGRSLKTLLGHTGPVRSVSFSPDGKTLATSGYDGTVRLWALDRGTNRVIGQHSGRVYSIAYDPAGTKLGTACSDGTARIWDLRTGNALTLQGHRGEVNVIRFSADSKLVATGSDDRTVRIWDSQTGRPYWRGAALLTSAWLYSHLGWQQLRADSSEHGQELPQTTAWRRAIEERARAVDQASDDALLCLATFASELEVWDIKADRQLLRRPIPDLEAVLAIPEGCVTRSRDRVELHQRSGLGRVLVRGELTAIGWQRSQILVGADKKVRSFSAAGDPVAVLPADMGITAISRDDKFMIVGYRDGSIELLSLTDGKRRAGLAFEAAPAAAVTRLLAAPMDLLIAGFSNGEVGIWSMKTGEQLGQGHLHGAVTHLFLKQGQLSAATELGSHLAWDLSVLSKEHCALLREVWNNVPVVWENGIPVRRPPPAGHPCL